MEEVALSQGLLWLGFDGNFKLTSREVTQVLLALWGFVKMVAIPPVLSAEKLGVGIHTIHYWREKGILEAFQETPKGPWWHRVTPETLKTLRDKIRRVPVKEE